MMHFFACVFEIASYVVRNHEILIIDHTHEQSMLRAQ